MAVLLLLFGTLIVVTHLAKGEHVLQKKAVEQVII
jgi:hypothetical protein